MGSDAEAYGAHSMEDSINVLAESENKGRTIGSLPYARKTKREGLLKGDINSPTWLFSEILQTITSEQDKSVYAIVDKGNDLVQLLKQHPGLKRDIALRHLINRIQFMLIHPATEVRALCYRILRYTIVDYNSLQFIIQCKILIFVIVSLTSDNSLLEKKEAIKLIREFLTVPHGTDNLSIGIVKSIVAIFEAEDTESSATEHFQMLCLETICELAVLKPELIFHSGAFRTVIYALIEKSVEESLNCLVVLLSTLDAEESRKYLRNGADLKALIGFFSNLGAEQADCNLFIPQIQKMAFVIATLLKNWNGLMCFAHNNFESLRDLVACMKMNNSTIRDVILDIFLDILLIRALPWLKTSAIADYIGSNNRYNHRQDYTFEYAKEKDAFEELIINHYSGLVAILLINNNIVTVLTGIIEADNQNSVVEKAKLLLSHLYYTAHRFLPNELLNDKLLLPSTVDKRIHLSMFYDFGKDKSRSDDSYTKSLKSSLKDLEIKATYYVDDNELKSWINQSKVLTVKEFEEWNWEVLYKLVQGPLRNPKRFNEILEKNPKFLKRLLSFYRPFKFRFCNVLMDSKNSRMYIATGIEVFESLLASQSGIKYFSSNKILTQITEIFAQVDPFSGITAKEPILSKKRLETTLSCGYLQLVGVLSNSNEGIELLSQWQFFNLLQNIVLGSAYSDSNNSLILLLFKYLDFSNDNLFRIILEKALTVSNFYLKNSILEVVVPELLKRKECEFFCIKLLVTSCYDQSRRISSKSVHLLNQFCSVDERKRIEYLIDLRPCVSILEKHESGQILLMYILKSSKGFSYLDSSGFIDNEFDKWLKLSNFDYLSFIESAIKKRYFPFLPQPTFKPGVMFRFFSHLLNTEEGLFYMQNAKQKEYLKSIILNIDDLVEEIDNSDNELLLEYKLDNEDRNRLMSTLKQNLWIIGDIAASRFGIKLLDSMSSESLQIPLVANILQLFLSSPIWQVRGVCFYQLGRIASTIEGTEILDDLGWYSVFDNYNTPMSLCYPKDVISKDLFKVSVNNPYRDVKYYALFGSDEGMFEVGNKLFEDLDSDELLDERNIHERILNLMKQLNSVLSRYVRRAIKQISMMKRKVPSIFESVPFFLKVVRLIDTGNYSYNIRKFIIELFLDTNVFKELIETNRRGSITG